jgi:trimeric autotransporter adhesin
VRIYDGATGRLSKSFFAYSIYWHGGVNVAVGDVNGDGRADLVTGAEAGGGPNVKAFDGKSLAAFRIFMAYDPHFRGGVRVAVGDVNGDGKADIITAPGAGMASFVKTFSGATGSLISTFMAYDPGWMGGAFVAAGDLDGDGKADIVTGADAGGMAHVKAVSGANQALLASFASDADFRGGIRVAVRDVDGDGKSEIITSQGRGGSNVRLFRNTGSSMLASFLAGDLHNPTGLFVG